jgi:hypothetical protein
MPSYAIREKNWVVLPSATEIEAVDPLIDSEPFRLPADPAFASAASACSSKLAS